MKEEKKTIFNDEIYDDIMGKLYSMNHDIKIMFRIIQILALVVSFCLTDCLIRILS